MNVFIRQMDTEKQTKHKQVENKCMATKGETWQRG